MTICFNNLGFNSLSPEAISHSGHALLSGELVGIQELKLDAPGYVFFVVHWF